MGTAAINTETLNIIQAITVVIIPFLTIFVAQRLVIVEARRKIVEARRKEVRDLLSKLNYDLQYFTDCALEVHPSRFEQPHADLAHLNAAKLEFVRSRLTLYSATTSLQLVLDNKATRLAEMVNPLLSGVLNMMNFDEPATPQEVSAYLLEQQQAFRVEMQKVWDEIKKERWFQGN